MTAREWAAKHWEVVKAYGEGKKIREFAKLPGVWLDTDTPVWDDETLYHVKPGPKLVPYGPEDADKLWGRKAKSKNAGDIFLIIDFDGPSVLLYNDWWVSYEELFDNYLDVTDTPEGVRFGKVVE